MKQRPIAPAGLQMPDYVEGWLGHRGQLLEHGFSDPVIGTSWWNERLAGKQMHQQVRLYDHDGRQMLTRGDLFTLGQRAVAVDASDDDVLTLLWNVLAWGTGASQRETRCAYVRSRVTGCGDASTYSVRRSDTR